ncbi:unnamed protein product, partial [Mesorhabditis spiculigera]
MNVTAMDERFSLMNDKQQLHIEEATLEDAGRYSCIAENKQGRAEKDLRVEILKPPKMDIANQAKDVLEGQSTTLECPISENLEHTEIMWTKNGVPITTSQRLQLSITKDKLHIMGAEPSDTAQFACTAKNNAGEDQAFFGVTVATAPKILSPAFQKLDVITNQTVEVECEATGTPTPTIEWTRDGKPLTMLPNVKVEDGGRILKITGVLQSDAGRYSCKAENKAGQAEADTFLSVNSPPSVKMVSEDLKVIEGHGITIRCEVSGSPAPQIEWQKDGQPYNNGLIQSQLFIHIQDAKPEDAGRYTCIGSNRAGEQRANAQLQVLTPPKIENDERLLQVKEGTDLTIDCAASGNPTPKITWKRDGVLMKNQDSVKLVIPSANATVAGKYTCEARNEAGVARADFAVDVLVKPRFKKSDNLIRVIDGENARLECKAEGQPTPTIKWLRGGRPLDVEEMDNLILSPRGETMMIVKARRSDAGSYSCVAKNSAGEAENSYTVEVLTPPHINETIDQSPRVVQGKDLLLSCPVLGNPDPKVEWLKDGEKFKIEGRFKVIDGKHLQITKIQKGDERRYTCNATNDAGNLPTVFKPEVIAPPKLNITGQVEYEVLVGESVTITCPVSSDPLPEINWLNNRDGKATNALVLTKDMQMSPDGKQLVLRNAKIEDSGKFVCRASNEAGSSDVHILLRVLLAPTIDRSNIIGNPLAIINKSIVLECPYAGIPTPTMRWAKNGKLIESDDPHYSFLNKNQSIRVNNVNLSDQSRLTCIASSKAGKAEEDFFLEVLTPPTMDTTAPQKIYKREGDILTLNCPVKKHMDGTEPAEVSWIKDGRPMELLSMGNVEFSNHNRRMTVKSSTVNDAGAYTCVAMNRAGESTLDFTVEVLSPPAMDPSKAPERKITVHAGQPMSIYCPVVGHPFPTIKWTKDGKEVRDFDAYRLSDNNQTIEIIVSKAEDAGQWACTAENDAGVSHMETDLDVWGPPTVQVHSDDPIQPIGMSVTLYCNGSGNPDPRLIWSKNGSPILFDDLRARVSLRGNRVDIPKLEKSDVGTYTCTAENDVGMASDSISVDVLVPPVIQRDNVEMSPRLPTGQVLTLLCDATGKPEPEYTWYAKDVEIKASTDELVMDKDKKFIQLTNVTLADRGIYKCVAKNVAGEDTLLYNVDIVQPPQIENGGTQQVIEGDTATISCAASGHPEPVVSWLRNGVRLETGITGVRYHAEGPTLKVVDSRSSDSGIYVCSATNEAGQAQQAYTLEVLVSPKITTTSPELGTVPLGQPFSLKCGVKGYPEPEISWTVNEQPITSGADGYTIAEDGTLFSQAAKGKESNYRCTAKNDAGTDHVEYVVKTISAPVLKKDGSHVMNATETEPVIITCEIEGDSPIIHWYKNGVPVATTASVTFSEDKSALSLQSARLSDEGEYSCVAANSAGNVTQKIQLYVGVPPKITDKPRRVVVKEGESTELWCEAVGVPPPTIMWLNENRSLPHTATDENSDSRKSSALFKAITSNDSGVYTCRAENWAGTSYKDVDLVVTIPPAVFPEKSNTTVSERETVLLDCNATGNPEPVVSWVRAPSTEITASEKYQLLGTSLAIRNILSDDEGFYHCIAKSEAGSAIGSRRLVVIRPQDRAKAIWVECDEEGKPVKSSFVPGRGDVPDDNTGMLHWGDIRDRSLDGTNVSWKCLPGPRGPRDLGPPHFIHQPKDTDLLTGQSVTLTCSAEGPPVPDISWKHNGLPLDVPKAASGYSQLTVVMHDKSNAGNYTCVAQNSVGESLSTAVIDYAEPPADRYEDDEVPTTKAYPTRKIAVIDCLDRGKVQQSGMTWMHGDRPIDPATEPVVLLNNGSMVVLDVDSVTPETLDSYHCRMGKRKRKTRKHLMEVDDAPPKVAVPNPVQMADEGEEVVMDCLLAEGQPLTTDIKWMKGDQPLVQTDNVYILPNNSLYIEEIVTEDLGDYKCRAKNSLGTSFDDVFLKNTEDEGKVGILPGYVVDGKTGQLILQTLTTPPSLQRIAPNKSKKTARELIEELLNRNLAKHLPDMEQTPEIYEKTMDFKFSTGDRYEAEQKVNRTDPNHPIIGKFSGSLPFENDTHEAKLENVTTRVTEIAAGEFVAVGSADLVVGDEIVNIGTYEKLKFNMTDLKIQPGRSIRLEMEFLEGNRNATVQPHLEDDCGEGFEQNDNGYCSDIDECERNITICDKYENCENLDGTYECQPLCEKGFMPKLDDGVCVDIDECDDNPCQASEFCMNTDGSYICLDRNPCQPGFWYNSHSDMCEDINECEKEHPCSANLKCINQLGSFICLCPNGHPPRDGNCAAVKHRITKVQDAKHHKCGPGFHWDPIVNECTDVDECVHDWKCEWKCHNTIGGYECQCPEGYYLGEDNKCKDIDECENPNICAGTGGAELCFNNFGSYQCLSHPCPKDYHIVDNSECHHDCHDCHKPVIRLQMLPVIASVPINSALAKLTAYDKNSRIVADTIYTISEDQDEEKTKGRTTAGTYGIRTDHGQATILSAAPLKPNETTKLRVYANSETNDNSHYLLHVHVSKYNF